ncbi:MAG TPA: sugar phosphate isomerase/epimerase [Kiritimatiellae bacterium]|nr:sugar phosphate isomerase/epimerase [Kiritimatiellia bacterium]
MEIGISTRWSAFRHASGENLAAELAELGFRTVELGYDLRAELVPGIQAAVRQQVLRVASVHNFCPVPPNVSRGHPELHSLCALDEDERQRAVEHTIRTVRFAAEMSAAAVVVHAGRVRLPAMTERLAALYERGLRFQPRYERYKLSLLEKRERRSGRYLDQLRRSLEQMIPVLERESVTLALENLPTWESVPTELEMETILREFAGKRIGYWHDLGHARVRENLGFISHLRWLERLSSGVVGIHIHDVLPPIYDHLVPPRGEVPFEQFKNVAKTVSRRIMEPAPSTPAQDVVAGRQYLEKVWGGQS